VLIAALARRWALTAVAVVVTVTIAAVVASSFVAVETSAAIRVMSMNMQFGKADTSEILRLAKRDDDVLAVQEMTPKAAALLSAAVSDAVLPHRFIDPQPARRESGYGAASR
jgi:hypothetical protein